MDVGRAFGFVFRDPRWLPKVAIGGLLLLVPILNILALGGFTLRVLRSVIGGVDEPLPEWSDFGNILADGVKVLVVTLVWGLPATVLNLLARGADSGAAAGLSCLAFLVSLAVTFVTPAILAHVAVGNSIAAGFDFSAILATVQRGIGNYVIVLLMSIVLGFVAVAGLIGLCIGVLFTTFYALVVGAHLYGQAYRLAQPGGAYAGAAPTPAPRF